MNTPPEGFVYAPFWLSLEEEEACLAFFRTLVFRPYVMRGQASRRGIAFFGTGYQARLHHEQRTQIPAVLLPLQARAAALVAKPAASFSELLVTHYPVGATIGWHRDFASFGSEIIGVSLLGECRMRFRRRSDPKEVRMQTLAPRSAYVIGKEARSDWEHAIPAVHHERYSLTFREPLRV